MKNKYVLINLIIAIIVTICTIITSVAFAFKPNDILAIICFVLALFTLVGCRICFGYEVYISKKNLAKPDDFKNNNQIIEDKIKENK